MIKASHTGRQRHLSVVTVLRKRKQEDQKFKVCLSYLVSGQPEVHKALSQKIKFKNHPPQNFVFCFLFFKARFLCVDLAVLHSLRRQGRPQTQRSAHLRLPSARIKGMHHHPAIIQYCESKFLFHIFYRIHLLESSC